MPFPIRVHQDDPDLTDQQKRVATQARRLCQQVKRDADRAEWEFRQEARKTHQHLKHLLKNKVWAMEILSQVEVECPWIKEEDERPFIRVF